MIDEAISLRDKVEVGASSFRPEIRDTGTLISLANFRTLCSQCSAGNA